MEDLGILAAVVFAYSLASARLKRMAITAPMAFIAAGIVLGPSVLGVTDVKLTGETGLLLAEVALVIVLFADAARIDLGVLRGNLNLPTRMLAIGMPLTIALGVGTGTLLLTDLDLWEAAIVAAILAPTDAALGQAVITDQRVPQRIRQTLNVESGLNDGLSIPFLFLFIGLAVEQAGLGGSGIVGFAAEQVGLGVAVGVAVGGLGGTLIERSIERDWIGATFLQLAFVALALIAWALAESVGGNGFIAAFSGGLAAGRITADCGQRMLDFTEDEGQLLNLAVFFMFGASAIGFLAATGWDIVLYAALSLTVIRMLPVAIATVGTGLRASTVAFLGWFGPRGLVTIILALIVVEEEPDLPALDVILAAMTVTVLASALLHGLSARPLARIYSERLASMPREDAEMATVTDLPARGG